VTGATPRRRSFLFGFSSGSLRLIMAASCLEYLSVLPKNRSPRPGAGYDD
jgi:hypothetical protein